MVDEALDETGKAALEGKAKGTSTGNSEPTDAKAPGIRAPSRPGGNGAGTDLEDDFADFVDEELGYAEIDWDTLPEKEVDFHDRIRRMPQGELEKLVLDELSDFCRWAAARAYLRLGLEEPFEQTALPLIASQKRSPALDYVDILLALMGRYARRGAFNDAFDMLDLLDELAPEDDLLKERFRGILTIQHGATEEGLEQLAQLAERRPDDAYFLLSLGEDLCGLGLWEDALEYLEISEEIARSHNDQELLSSIDNAVQFAQRQIGYGDAE
jgi:tetratricopeptide (TPR) repeat protein